MKQAVKTTQETVHIPPRHLCASLKGAVGHMEAAAAHIQQYG